MSVFCHKAEQNARQNAVSHLLAYCHKAEQNASWNVVSHLSVCFHKAEQNPNPMWCLNCLHTVTK